VRPAWRLIKTARRAASQDCNEPFPIIEATAQVNHDHV
jgi:hypothetical protein